MATWKSLLVEAEEALQEELELATAAASVQAQNRRYFHRHQVVSAFSSQGRWSTRKPARLAVKKAAGSASCHLRRFHHRGLSTRATTSL
jgi:hypothetical protein